MYSDETAHRMALLKTARQELNNQYIQERSAAFTQWSIDCDRVWKESGIKLPFPPPGPVPTESDIVAYALALYNAQNPQSAPTAPEATPPVHTVVESVPISTPTIVTQEPVHEEPVHTESVVLPVPVVATIEPVTISAPEPVAVAPAVDVVADNVPIVVEPVIETIPESLPVPISAVGATDFDKREAAIKEIFSAPAADPLTMTSGTPSPSVLPLIKGMLKKGLLPSWVRSSDAGIKE